MIVLIMVACASDAAGCRRGAMIAVQARVIEVLAAETARLAGQVAGLAARVERLASRNSGNSFMPPSADDLPGGTPPRKQPGGGNRKQRKQPGPQGHLAWSACPDDTVPQLPAGCECGTALDGAPDLGVVASHQQIEIPLGSAQVIQRLVHISVIMPDRPRARSAR